MATRGLRLISLAAISALVLSACNSSTATSTPATATPSPSPTGADTTQPAPGGGLTIHWFVGLDLGTSDAQIAAQKAFVTSYNSVNKSGITLKLEVVPTATAADVLKTEMAAGSAPDIVGPLGIGDLNGLEGLFLDLGPEITKNQIDLTAYDPALMKFLQVGAQGQVGLPYIISPGYIWYDKDIFAKAGLPNLPTRVGEQYQGQTWDWTELGKVAAQLTLDKNGKKATDAGFDPKNIVSYGLDFQSNDLRRMGSCFGSGSLISNDGKTAQLPSAWSDAISWYYNGIWGKTPFIPNGTAEGTDLLDQGNSQASGNVAMNVAWTSSISTIATDAATSNVKSWDIAVMPSWKGTTTSPMYADTFAITKASKSQDAAFKVMLAIMADQTLLKSYGGQPAKTVDQPAYFAGYDQSLAAIFPTVKVTWSVLGEMQKYPAVPSFEADMPGLAQVQTDAAAFLTKLQGTSGLDVPGELTKFLTTLQQDFDSAQPLVNQ